MNGIDTMDLLSMLVVLILILIFAMIYPICRWNGSYKLLLEVLGEKNQAFSPGMSYLLIIPIIGQFWWLYKVYYVKVSLEAMKADFKLPRSEDGGFTRSHIFFLRTFHDDATLYSHLWYS